MQKFVAFIHRHAQAFWYVLTVVIPVILRTGRRPVIFSKYSGIGDIICTFPAALELKKRHPGATFIYNCHQPYACLPVMAEVTNRVTSIRHAGVLRHWYGWMFTSFYEFPSADESTLNFCKKYMVEEYADNHRVDVVSRHPRIKIPPEASTKAACLQKKLSVHVDPKIVIHPGPTWPVKEWPQDRWVELVNEFKKRGYSTIIQVGTTNHLAMGVVEADALLVPGTISLVNQLTLEETAAVIASASLFVGVDSGLIHLAASLDVRCVGILGPTSPHIILPPAIAANSIISRIECQGCHHRVPRIHWETGCPHNIACMKGIAADEVLKNCLHLLQPHPESA